MKTQIKTLSLFTATLCAASASAAPIAGGTTIGVDFGPTASTNNFNDATTTAGTMAAGSIIDTSNVIVDGVAFSWANAEYINNDAADSTDLPGQASQFNDSNLTDWILNGNSTSLVLTFTGLNDSLTYDLTIGSGYNGGSVNTDTTWTVDGQSATTNHGVGAEAYVTLTGLSTDGSGTLVISSAGSGDNSNFNAVSALELVAVVPEPSSLALIGLGGLLIARRRRG